MEQHRKCDKPQEQSHQEGVAEQNTGCVDSDMEKRLEDALAEAEKNWDLFLRSRAELSNFKARVERDYEASLRRGKKDLFLKILEIKDNFDRALGTENTSLEAFVEGMRIIARQIDSLLAFEDVQPVEAVGKPFDPALHDAVASWESDEVAEPTCTDEIQRGFIYKGEVLRPARVRVAKPKSE